MNQHQVAGTGGCEPSFSRPAPFASRAPGYLWTGSCRNHAAAAWPELRRTITRFCGRPYLQRRLRVIEVEIDPRPARVTVVLDASADRPCFRRGQAARDPYPRPESD